MSGRWANKSRDNSCRHVTYLHTGVHLLGALINGDASRDLLSSFDVVYLCVVLRAGRRVPGAVLPPALNIGR
jgi:hypothetical protein